MKLFFQKNGFGRHVQAKKSCWNVFFGAAKTVKKISWNFQRVS